MDVDHWSQFLRPFWVEVPDRTIQMVLSIHASYMLNACQSWLLNWPPIDQFRFTSRTVPTWSVDAKVWCGAQRYRGDARASLWAGLHWGPYQEWTHLLRLCIQCSRCCKCWPRNMFDCLMMLDEPEARGVKSSQFMGISLNFMGQATVIYWSFMVISSSQIAWHPWHPLRHWQRGGFGSRSETWWSRPVGAASGATLWTWDCTERTGFLGMGSSLGPEMRSGCRKSIEIHCRNM